MTERLTKRNEKGEAGLIINGSATRMAYVNNASDERKKCCEIYNAATDKLCDLEDVVEIILNNNLINLIALVKLQKTNAEDYKKIFNLFVIKVVE